MASVTGPDTTFCVCDRGKLSLKRSAKIAVKEHPAWEKNN